MKKKTRRPPKFFPMGFMADPSLHRKLIENMRYQQHRVERQGEQSTVQTGKTYIIRPRSYPDVAREPH